MLTPGSISLLGKLPNEDIPDVPVMFLGFVLTLILLSDEAERRALILSICSAERTVLAERICFRSFTADGLDPSESLDVEDGPRVREDDGAVNQRPLSDPFPATLSAF